VSVTCRKSFINVNIYGIILKQITQIKNIWNKKASEEVNVWLGNNHRTSGLRL